MDIATSILKDELGKAAEVEIRTVEIDGFPAPEIPGESSLGLTPFCRLETTRSSWIIDESATSTNVYSGLKVDLDSTNTGHAVGEVEAVVENDKDIPGAQKLVHDLIAELCGGSNDGPALGKLEHFLIHNRPDHYDLCVRSGVIKKQS